MIVLHGRGEPHRAVRIHLGGALGLLVLAGQAAIIIELLVVFKLVRVGVARTDRFIILIADVEFWRALAECLVVRLITNWSVPTLVALFQEI